MNEQSTGGELIALVSLSAEQIEQNPAPTLTPLRDRMQNARMHGAVCVQSHSATDNEISKGSFRHMFVLREQVFVVFFL